MICPYCKKKLPDGVQFCSKCGQVITNTPNNTHNTINYWKDVDKLNDANENERLSVIRQAKTEARARNLAVIRKLIMVATVVAVLVIATIVLDTSSQEKLEFIKSDAVGKTYSDTKNGSVMFNGDKKERIIIIIKDENILSYTRGNYTLRVLEEDGRYSMSWKQNEIFEANDYEYVFSTTLFGKIALEFNGKSYEVEIDDDDGTINSINFYDD